MQAACNMLLEISQQGLQHYFRPHRNQRSTRQVMRPQNCGNPNEGEFRDSHLGISRQKAIWMWPSWRGA